MRVLLKADTLSVVHAQKREMLECVARAGYTREVGRGTSPHFFRWMAILSAVEREEFRHPKLQDLQSRVIADCGDIRRDHWPGPNCSSLAQEAS